jgi:hypothetical protein
LVSRAARRNGAGGTASRGRRATPVATPSPASGPVRDRWRREGHVAPRGTGRGGHASSTHGLGRGAQPINEVHVPERDLSVTAFVGFSLLTGTREALAPVRSLRATVFVASLKEIEERLVKTGWKLGGHLGSDRSLLARDCDGNMFESVEEPEGNPGRP